MTLKTRSLLLAVVALSAAAATLSGCSSSPTASTATPATASAAPTTAPGTTPDPRSTPSNAVTTSDAPAPQLTEKQQADIRKNLMSAYTAYEQSVAAMRLGQPDKGDLNAALACGTAHGKDGIDGVLLDQISVDQGGAVKTTVHLYIGAKQVATAQVTSDPATGKPTDFACGPAADSPALGATTIAGYYGSTVAVNYGGAPANLDTSVSPAFQKFGWSGLDAQDTTCSQDVPQFWSAASTPSAAEPNLWTMDHMTVAVDSSGKQIAWVNCHGLPDLPTPAKQPTSTEVRQYVSDLWYSYAYLQALKPYGVDPTQIKPYFLSDAAYAAAWKNSGTVPLECAPTLAGSFSADKVTITGKSAVVAMTALPSWHPLSVGEKALGHPKVTLDLTTMKVSAVTCS